MKKKFSTIDLRYAHSQLPLDEKTAKHRNFNIIGGQATGTYRFNIGIYGITDMRAESQKAIEKTLHILTNKFSFLYDIIIVTGVGLKNHEEKLFKSLDRLNEENLAINLNKSHFAKKNKITWLCYEIDQKDLKPIVSKTQAILNLKPPRSHNQIKSFLGSVHHLTIFTSNSASLCREFRNLLHKRLKVRMGGGAPPNKVRNKNQVHPESNGKQTLRHKKEDQSQNRCIEIRLRSSSRKRDMQRMRNNVLPLQIFK